MHDAAVAVQRDAVVSVVVGNGFLQQVALLAVRCGFVEADFGLGHRAFDGRALNAQADVKGFVCGCLTSTTTTCNQ